MRLRKYRLYHILTHLHIIELLVYILALIVVYKYEHWHNFGLFHSVCIYMY